MQIKVIQEASDENSSASEMLKKSSSVLTRKAMHINIERWELLKSKSYLNKSVQNFFNQKLTLINSKNGIKSFFNNPYQIPFYKNAITSKNTFNVQDLIVSSELKLVTSL